MIKQLLEEFMLIDGVTTAALIGEDGFLIESAGSEPIDKDALAALGSCAMKFFTAFGRVLERGDARQFVLEHNNGSIIFTQVADETLLAVITETQSGTGRLTYFLPKITPRVAAAI